MILCCGEALIDMLPTTNASGQSAFMPVVGGSVFNSAVALGRLNIATGFFSGLSRDFFGDMLCQTLDEAKVDYSFAVRSHKPTTLAFVKLINQQAQYAFFDENTAGRMLEYSDVPEISAKISTLLFGCISLIAEPCASVYEALMTKAAAQKVIYLDPNIRANFISNRQQHYARLHKMIGHSDILKLSDEDLRWFDGDVTFDDFANQMLQIGPKLVVITKGKQGIVAYSKHHCVDIVGEKIEVFDTVGAGDTVNAGILASLEQQNLLQKNAINSLTDEQIYNALSLANKAAAITVSRAGANPPWYYEV